MAVITPLVSPVNIKGVSRTLTGTKKSLKQTNNTFKEISEILVKKTKVRSELFRENMESKRRREIAASRKEEEDRLEAPNIVKMAIPTQMISLVQNSGRSLFGRILSTLGYLAAGWVLRNLPTWIALGKEFITRIQIAGDIIKNFVTNTINVFTSTFNVLQSFKTNLMNFDLFDSSNRVKNSFDELKTSIDNMGIELENAIKLVTTPLTQPTSYGTQEGTYSGENVPGLGTTSEDMGAYSGTTSSAGRYGTREQRALLDAISFAEGTSKGYGIIYGGSNVPELSRGELTVRQVYNMMMSGKLNGRNVGYKSGSRATGRYQFMPDTLSDIVKTGVISWDEKFTPEAQDRAILARISSFRGVTPELLRKEGLSAKVSNMLAPEFASLPTYSGKSFHGQPVKSLKSVQEKYKQSLGSSGQTETQNNTQAKVTSVPMVGKIPDISVGERAGYSPRRGRVHAGRDIAAPSGTGLTVPSDSVIIAKDFEKEGYGNYVIFKDSKGVEHMYGHMLEESPFKPGDMVKRGQIIGRVGSTGRSTGSHLHWEVSPRSGEVGFSRRNIIDPIEFGYSSKVPFTSRVSAQEMKSQKPVAVTSPAQIAGTPQQQQMQGRSQALTPERRAQDVMAFIPTPQQQAPTTQSIPSSPYRGSAGPSMADVLNNFMKQKLLLDLAYV